MWRNTVFAVAAVSIFPLVATTLVNYFLYQRSFNEEIIQPFHRTAAITKNSVEAFLEERIAAAHYILSRESLDDLYDPIKLGRIFRNMRTSFGGIVDIGIIDRHGVMRSYAGPYDLQKKNYKDQQWFNEVLVRDMVVSDVFLGHRNLPHFAVALKREDDDGRLAIFRATIDSAVLSRLIRVSITGGKFVSLIINEQGITQTGTRLFGPPLSHFDAPVPPNTEQTEIIESVEIGGSRYLMGYSCIKESPFMFVVLARDKDLRAGWLTYQGEMFAFLAFSVLAILLLIMWITTTWVNRIRDADLRREATLHSAEHTNKMASIGRLAAGVAHEINNPLAIINERAGLINDLLNVPADAPDREKLQKQVESIINSVKRCAEITHRLLGFARHMDVKNEPLAIDGLLRDVLGFLNSEATHLGIQVNLKVTDSLPTVHSDKGQIQQLFLNIINNAFAAMSKGGRLDVDICDHPPSSVRVKITDDGMGIAQKDLERIFEPFYTTKKDKGTGLGLSICYGIVQKLKGSMTVTSREGEGTTFTITLPTSRTD